MAVKTDLIKLFNGDCLEIMPTLEDQSIDMILCDLPYGTTACSWDTVIPFAPLWVQYKRLIKPRGAIVLFGSQPFTSALIMSNVKWFKYCWVWDKVLSVGHLIVNKRPMQQTEDIVIFGKEAINYYPAMQRRQSARHVIKRIGQGDTVHMSHEQKTNYDVWLDARYPTNLLEFSNSFREGLHPTQKPVALLAYLIRTYTNPGDTVLDNCMGSGSTGVACIQESRAFIGIEKEQNYFEIAKNRIENTQPPLPFTVAEEKEKTVQTALF